MTHTEALVACLYELPVIYKDRQGQDIHMTRIDHIKELFCDGVFFRDAVMVTGHNVAQALIDNVRAENPKKLAELVEIVKSMGGRFKQIAQ